ncbi:MAG TPA: 23S rRNA (guanosine(2251)-2'-O)-methyltransferase RlmB [Pyrinomonadaceae bacterium]|nr:23S rRNA (guanosine(2251)-2'-O)-methyltransferase RlmB [Pyrinomonadaceae bacterium]
MNPEKPKSAKIYGVLPILEALRSGKRNVEQITIADGAQINRLRDLLHLAKEQGIIVNRVPKNTLAKFVEPGANHQGVVATIAAAKYANADELLENLTAKIGSGDEPLTVVLDGVEDPRNLGAIARTAECAGAHGIFLPERRAVGLTETVAKTAAGALEYLPVAKVVNLNRLLEDLKERGIWIVGTSANAKMSYTDWDWTIPSAIVLGGEGKGLHRLVEENCDALVKIPLSGKIESLNVSVAAGVILYEARRQRNSQQSSVNS